MNPPKVTKSDYINFLIAAQKAYSCTEAERVQPEATNEVAQEFHHPLSAALLFQPAPSNPLMVR